VRPRVRALAESVDGLIVGNRRLLEYLPPKPNWFVPTCIDPAEWPVEPPARKGPPVLGWVGTVGNMAYLSPLAPVLAEACRKHGARLRVVCSHPPDLPGVPVDFVKWSAEREVEDLLPMDVGLAPLDEGAMKRCKCAFKSIQYMAAGLPVIASPVGANADVVEDGITGFHAADAAAWARALDGLLSDPALRARMGAAGRAAAAAKWSFDAHEGEFLDAMRGIER
jgi:glycosyltransferase involved in cell wall biosynthesis